MGLCLAFPAVPASAQGTLDFARQLYNQGRYEQAIAAAARLRTSPTTADGANLVLGRAQLERFRQTADRADLVAARDALRDVQPDRLTGSDRTQYLVGLGEWLFLDESYGPAAEVLQGTLDRIGDMGPRAWDRVFDWWATSLERQVQAGNADDRDVVYNRIRRRAEAELARMPGSTAAAYWLVTSLRSLGDLGRAWDAAMAGWVRARMADDQGVRLRADLDRLVMQAIIPERARQLASADRDRERAATSLRATWDSMKQDWGGR
ncbi:MAG TPA: hypothetical protein VGK32_04255 [Vicinamibacterales bacterium]|jgi:hypothetical protein